MANENLEFDDIQLSEDEEIFDETVEELSNGIGDDEDDE